MFIITPQVLRNVCLLGNQLTKLKYNILNLQMQYKLFKDI